MRQAVGERRRRHRVRAMLRAAAIGIVPLLLASCGGGSSGPIDAPEPDEVMPQVLAGDEVGAIMQQAARALPREMAVAVTDRRGVILGVGTNFALRYAVTCGSCPPTTIDLRGGLGVSVDGVEQDDVVTAAAVRAGTGFEAPPAVRADRVVVRDVRLPYLKFNRNPEE